MAENPSSSDNFRKIFVAGVFAVFFAYGAFVLLAPGPAELAVEHVVTATAAVERYREENGELPSDLEVLVRNGYLVTNKDNFGFGLMYREFGDRFEIYSVGPDGAPATPDDVYARGEGT